MRKLVLTIVVILLLLIGAAIAGASAFLRRGISAREEPGAVETFVARRLRHLAIPRGARELRNPLPATPEVLADGRAHFADHCATCHANDGSGRTEMGQGLYPKAPDMKLPATQALSDGEMFHIIRNGVRFTGMPAWGEGRAEEDRESWALVHFIRHLPEITLEEIEEMKELNPRTPEEHEESRTPPAGDEKPHRHGHSGHRH